MSIFSRYAARLFLELLPCFAYSTPIRRGRKVISSRKRWKVNDWDSSELRCFPEYHISIRPKDGWVCCSHFVGCLHRNLPANLVLSLVQSDYQIRSYGTSHTVGDVFRSKFFERRLRVWSILGQCGFHDFIFSMTSQSYSLVPKLMVFGLTEWFWDTINTFHFPWGEMALTPYDFAMLTGLSFTERLVPMDNEIKITDP